MVLNIKQGTAANTIDQFKSDVSNARKSAEDIARQLQDLERRMAAVRDAAQLRALRLENHYQKTTQTILTLTAIVKKLSDSSKGITSNIK